MKFYFIIVLLVLGMNHLKAGESEFLAALANYKEASREHGVSEMFFTASGDLLKEWGRLDETNKIRWADKLALVHYHRAEFFSQRSQYEMAARELADELKTQAAFGGKIEYSTKTPDAFFENLIELQALVTTETGSDPLAGQVGYYFEKDGNGFTAARLELYDDVAGITVPDVGDDDALALVYRLNRQGDKFVATTPKWLVVPKGELPDVLEQATREVAFDADGRMTVRNLEAQAEPSPKAEPSATDNTASPQVPSHVQPPAPGKPINQKPDPPAPSEEPSSSKRWPLVAAVIAAALGLLWVLLKKRK